MVIMLISLSNKRAVQVRLLFQHSFKEINFTKSCCILPLLLWAPEGLVGRAVLEVPAEREIKSFHWDLGADNKNIVHQ